MSQWHHMREHGPALLANGYSIVPIGPGSKAPATGSQFGWRPLRGWAGYAIAPPTAGAVEAWGRMPPCGVGIVCGDVVGIDLDVLDVAVAERLRNLTLERLGNTPCIRVGRAPKCLLLYRFEGGRAPAYSRAPIDIIGFGRQFVAFGVHPDTGREYGWPDENPVNVPVDELPAIGETALRAFVGEAWDMVPASLKPQRILAADGGDHASSIHGQEGTPEALASALEVLTNDDLDYDSWLAIGYAIKGGLRKHPDAAFELWCRWSATSAKDDPEYTASRWPAMNGVRAGAGTIYGEAQRLGWHCPEHVAMNGEDRARFAVLASLDDAPGAPTRAAEAEARDYAVPPELIAQAGPGLGAFVEWVTATAYRPQPFLALGAGIAAFGVLMARKYATARNLRSNVYVVGVAPSGGGKDHARGCVAELFAHAGAGAYLGGDRIASGSALTAALHRHPALLFQIDEFGALLKGITNERQASSHKAEILTNLTQLYTSANKTWFGTEYADQRQRPKTLVRHPCVCLNATTVPGSLWEALKQGAMSDGSMARMMLFRAEVEYPDSNLAAGAEDPPAALVELATRVLAGADGASGNLADLMLPDAAAEPYRVPQTAGAERAFADLDARQTKSLRAATTDAERSVLSRVGEQAMKLALIRAVTSAPERPVIGEGDVLWGEALTRHCLETLLSEAAAYVADNATESAHKRVLAIVAKAGPGGVSGRDIARATQFLKKRERGEIVDALVEGGLIGVESVNGGARGRPSHRYYLAALE